MYDESEEAIRFCEVNSIRLHPLRLPLSTRIMLRLRPNRPIRVTWWDRFVTDLYLWMDRRKS